MLAAMPSLLTPYDLYCERLDASFWAEPVNALSNAGFLVAAWLCWRLARRQAGGVTLQAATLITLMAMIGIGSFLFHTLAVFWAMLTDVIPIGLYQVMCVAFYGLHVARWPRRTVALIVAGFIAASATLAATPDRWLNGSLAYGAAFFMVLALGLYHWLARKREPYLLLWATLAAIGSLTCRVLDMKACAFTSLGTHAGWHLLNALALYAATRAVVINQAAPVPQAHTVQR